MKKKRTILTLLIVLVSIALVVGICVYLLDTSGKINQGNFRINDAVVKSMIETTEKEQVEGENAISNIVFDISQKNTLSLLIAKNVKMNQMYLNNFKLEKPNKTNQFYLSQASFDEKITTFDQNTVVNIYPTEKEEQYYVELNINNDNCVQDVNVPSETKLVKFDGTILDLLNIRVSDLMFKLSFDLTIVDETGKKNVCPISLSMPTEGIVTNGIDVIRQDLANYRFKIQ